ncbi:uncharacterized protein LOC112627369 [Theropithecus gelada]|uniref:uncharacterized protein LOC112627369 n=1 Tax=Theropithecus gelada TaxID=9565 RepID=UPI000DC16FDD|nr:uncharacterized protein LOC112627369 [Theropithecus gelada]
MQPAGEVLADSRRSRWRHPLPSPRPCPPRPGHPLADSLSSPPPLRRPAAPAAVPPGSGTRAGAVPGLPWRGAARAAQRQAGAPGRASTWRPAGWLWRAGAIRALTAATPSRTCAGRRLRRSRRPGRRVNTSRRGPHPFPSARGPGLFGDPGNVSHGMTLSRVSSLLLFSLWHFGNVWKGAPL